MFAILLTEGMNPFYQNISSFPTIIFTIVLVLMMLFWLIAVLGMVEIDALDVDLPNIDSAMDGALEGAIDGAGDGAAPNAIAGLLMRFGLVGVPVTVTITLIAIFGWLISYFCVYFISGIIPEGILRFLVGVPILLFAMYLSALITGQAIKPLRRFFKIAEQDTIKTIIGKTAIVRTSRVDHAFGEANLEDGGAGLILKVRASGDDTFKHGDRVVILEYLADANAYRIMHEAEFHQR